MQRLFHPARFSVIAPSEAALELWREATSLPYVAASVVAPARLDSLTDAVDAEDLIPDSRPVRIAYVGSQTLADGWPTYERILEACGDLAAYAFHHFAAADDLRPRGNLFSVETPAGEAALRARLIDRRVDLVVMAMEGPQTFSPLALAALAAGCDLIALDHSGHAAALVLEERRGRTFASADEAVAFFVDGRAVAYARERQRFPRAIGEIHTACAAALLG
jgi:hypothetical protein